MRRAPASLSETVARELEGMVKSGVLRTGDRLPSVRSFARQRGVSVSTVLLAYERLERLGCVDVRHKSGHFVAAPPQAPAPKRTRPKVSSAVSTLVKRLRHPSMVQLGGASVAPSLLPLRALNRTLSSLAREVSGLGARYENPRGLRTLRQQLVRRALSLGVTLDEDELIITTGATEALSLCLSTLARSSDAVAVESPAYFGWLQALEHLGIAAVEVPKSARHGLDLTALARVLEAGKVRALLCSPTVCNPLGSVMPEAQRAALAALLAKHHVPLIEDDALADTGWRGRRPKPVKAWDADVLWVGSVSKALALGYRVGWVAAGRHVAAVETGRLALSLAAATPMQAAVAEFLSSGAYERHLRKLGPSLEAQVCRYRAAVVKAFPAGTVVGEPAGGLLLWVELPEGVDAVRVCDAAAAAGISVAPGTLFGAAFRRCLRIGCGAPFDARVGAAIETLGRLAVDPKTRAP
ncbi:MAG: PLP-dependent aminotransferase family protein [Myxococcaceae bacterium]|nr:PLP-dependent aminotransferase family protein [Myxococcaceae bacterium]